MNGLQGRVLRAPSTRQRKREILMIYGHHAKLERWWGLVENLRTYGTVTMPDLPGFGGMQSFYDIGQKPTLDNYADYLAAFIRMRYKRRRVSIVAVSFGFIVVTRMLQRYPDLAKKVDVLASLVGFMHRDEFRATWAYRNGFRLFARLLATRPVALVLRHVFLNGPTIRFIYAQLPAGKRRLSSMDALEARRMLDYDVTLWHANHVPTHWRTTYEFLGLDNCQQKIDLPIYHVGSRNDHYFDNARIEAHMRTVFSDVHVTLIDAKAHTPSLLAGKRESGSMLPAGLRRALRG
jgi:pimeloyl-ACP methyl ester carboxylesterase